MFSTTETAYYFPSILLSFIKSLLWFKYVLQELKAKVAISEREGALDNKTKIELIKAEEKIIQEERAEQSEEDKKKSKEALEEIIDTAPVLKTDAVERDLEKFAQKEEKAEEITAQDFETLEKALDELGKEKKKLIVEKEELNELKEELQDYEEVKKLILLRIFWLNQTITN